MKKSSLIICIMLGALCMATTGCNKHDDDDDDQPSITNLAGKTWTFGYNNHTAIVEFNSSTFVIMDDDGDSESGTYSYDGNTFSCSFGYDETYNLYCLTKPNSSTSLEGSVWKFEEVYDGRVYTSTIYLYASSFTYKEDGYSYEERGSYAYDGNTLTASWDGDTYFLQCGRVLYEMARNNNTNIW